MEKTEKKAPGAPGKERPWTTGSKSGIGSVVDSNSNVAFTISKGVLTEVFYPRIDNACLRNMEFVVTDGNSFFSSEEKDARHSIDWMKEGVPAFKLSNKCTEYTLEKEIICDPLRDVVLQKITFNPSGDKAKSDYQLFALINPHINNKSADNYAWKGDYHGRSVLFASRENTTMAFACSASWIKTSVGFFGVSDGYTDLHKNYSMQWEYDRAEKGNVSLTAQIDLSSQNSFVCAIAFGATPEDAAHQAWASILDGFDHAKDMYIYEWQKWQRLLQNIKSDRNTIGTKFRSSAAVLRVQDSKNFPGGIIASLSKPWGESKSEDNSGGYHLVWPRDLVLSSGGYMNLQSRANLLRVLNYLMSTQRSDGCWTQNMWLEGISYWDGVQMDQVALSILLVSITHENGYLEDGRMKRYWPIVRKAIIYLLKNGPSTPQDRWEEETGITPFTLATEIAALLAAASLAKQNGEPDMAAYCLETADYWNENIEKWLYVTGTDITREVGVDGFYMRINSTCESAETVKDKVLNLKNHEGKEGEIKLGNLVCVDALALVRFGLRRADDPKIVNTLKVIDAKLKVETPSGPCWRRYVNDGYGEDKEGNFSPTKGIGRAWPLLTGERGHFEVAAGNIKKAKELLQTMESFSQNSLFPEQIWDEADIPEKGLYFGKATGSAMPLTWAHAEYIKLTASIKHKKISDLPTFTIDRYIKKPHPSPFTIWRFAQQISSAPKNKKIRIEVFAEATIKYTTNNWETFDEIPTQTFGIGIHLTEISVKDSGSDKLQFTFFWKEAKHWEEKNYWIELE